MRNTTAVSPPAADRTLVVDGGELHYDVSGEGPAVVFIHGGFGDRRVWDGVCGGLADFRVVRYDHRGFGRSPAPLAAYAPVADLVALLDHLGIDRAHLVGNSMGGALALDATLLHPDRVDSLTLVSTGPNGFPVTEAAVASVVSVFETAASDGPAAAAACWLRHPMVATTMRDAEAGPYLRAMVEANAAVFTMAHWPFEVLDPPAAERLATVRVPTLVVVGRADLPVVHAAAGAAAAGIPGAQLVYIEDADHLPQMAQPEAFGGALQTFLRRRPAPAR